MTTGQQAQAAPTSTLKRAYLQLERMQHQLAEHERMRTEPVAIVGMGMRFPGGAVDAESFWRILRDGVDAVDEIPADRWPVDEFYDAEPQQPGKMRTRWGGFLDRVDQFDYEFFGISRREALAMDPQQRLALEVSWEALENSGQAPTALAGSRTGVFLGVCSNDFATENFPGLEDITAYASTGTAHSVVTGRISYVFDFRGPSVAVDTACSSSLVSVHTAVQSLRAGECDLALGGGVNVVLSPLPSVAFSQFPGMVAPDGRCKTFDARANGYVRSEGCGIVVLKRLSDAVRDRDRVLAVIRGGAVNQDGRSSGVTAPNGVAQRDVLRRALAASGVAAEQVSYIEAHGTGTTLGDPIEVEALAEVYGREQGAPVYLGSSKTNIGHAEAASGIAGLIKVALALHHGAIPPNVHFTELNPHISFAGTTFVVPAALSDWPAVAERPIAGVSSFGFSGTNAHLILQAAPQPPATTEESGPERPRSVLPLSAKTPSGLLELAKRYQQRLTDDPATAPADICHSAGTGRAHFAHRLAAVGGSRQEIADQLADFVDGLPGDLPVVGEAGRDEVVFLFTGQGPQRVGMARTLYQTQPTFRQAIDRCDEILRPLLEVPLLDVIYPADPESDLVYRTTYSQPALFAVQYAMAQLWRSWGVEPVAVLGHSFGEYVAACVAGMMSLEDGLRLVVERGRLMWELAENGAMVAVFAAEAEVTEVLAPYADRVSVAAVNGPTTTSISGERAALAEICAEFDRRGVKTKQLHITTSSHSPLIEPILPGLRKAADAVTFSPPRIPLVANLTGELWPWDTAPDADYWCRHARQPVRFAASIDTLRELGYRTFVEMGPAPTLLGMISDNLPTGETLLAPSLRPKHDDWAVLLDTVAKLYAAGVNLDWHGFDRDYRRNRVPLPTYPFEKTHCWQEPRRKDRAYRGPDTTGPDDPPDEYADDDLLYRLDWQPVEAPVPAEDGAQAPARTWLVLADGAGIGARFADAMAARGDRTVRVAPGTAYRFDGGAEAEVRIDGPADLGRLLDELKLAGGDLQVLHLWSLDGDGADPADADDLDAAALLRAQERGSLSAVYAAQALARAQGPESVRLWLVTRGAVRPTGTTGTAPGPLLGTVAQSTLWGLGRSLQQEHAALWGGLIDLDPHAAPAALADRLADELTRRDAEDQVALHGDQRYVARLVRQAVPETGDTDGPWRPDASYLITGGLGGLGLAVARSMVQAGARRLVLLGRTAIPPRAEWADLPADGPVARRVAAVRELEALGASVHLASADVADEAAVRAFLAVYDREGWPPIRGVIHAAGTGDVAPLLEVTRADLERPLLPKAVGAWVLHRLFADRELDFFVLFSSTSSLLSSPFVAGYAAANAFLDALAQQRRAAGLPGLSVNWGIWDGVGLAARGADATPGLSKGMGVLRPGQALRVFHRLLHHDDAQVAVVPVDWAEWGRRYAEVSGSALLAPLLRGDGPARPARRKARASLLPTRAQLLALPADQRADTLTAQLVLGVAATLGAGSAAVRVDQSLFDLGLDSLMAVELKNEIERQLGVSLSIAVFLEGATLRTLTDQIISRLPAVDEDGTADPAAIQRVERFEDVAAELLAELADLSDEQARAVLGQEG
ncbi:type I polyketide synthase [Micromonospora yasonensis]|uniref:type I polyketide synthase n=1 Tax=Micromonospora yasonensis TaxID=1128667 RepID=UPI0022303E62|nr:type I polyketide synthase [Micromonospora yasonensis]MCW3841498.1 type I polyketide synthase [Micromonospora yasonensis]